MTPAKANCPEISGAMLNSRLARALMVDVSPSVRIPLCPSYLLPANHTLTWNPLFLIVTGCIRPSHLSRLNPGDAGGQYDSSGGVGGRGNPEGSVCLGYVYRLHCLLFFCIEMCLFIDTTIMLSLWSLQETGRASNAAMTPLTVLSTKVGVYESLLLTDY